ncbi:MAG: GtrA family protein [Sphingomonadaceae bacterium]|nr:GtrA family protein [Sphingomonadaceae bacterium]
MVADSLARALAPVPAYLRYGIASAVALGVDLVVFLAALQAHVAPTLASASGYAIGILAHWLVSSRFVFADGTPVTGGARHVQKVMFVLTAFVGLVLTVAVVAMGQIVDLDPRLAKLVAILVSFQSGWLMRRKIVFA